MIDQALTNRRSKRDALRAARFAPPARPLPEAFEGAKIVDQPAHARAERERDRLISLNLLGSLVEETARLRWTADLARSTPQRLAQLATDAAGRGDAPLLAMIADEVDSRGLRGVSGGQLRIAVQQAVDKIELPSWDAEQAELQELEGARRSIEGAWHEIESGEPDLAAASATIAEGGGAAYLDEAPKAREQEKLEASKLAERIVAEPVTTDVA